MLNDNALFALLLLGATLLCGMMFGIFVANIFWHQKLRSREIGRQHWQTRLSR
jgi:uncharacterized protein YneF (UPF0154 family)